jgi:putative hydrolase of the HAD superfamily
MTKKAIIFDLDNTIYPVASIGAHFFEPLFNLIANSGERFDMEAIRELVQRKPFQYVAEKFGMSQPLRENAMNLLSELTYDKPMQPYSGYEQLRALSLRKFLVTAGFTNMQFSKIRQLGIEKDFEAVYIIDPLIGGDTKKSKFADIMSINSFKPGEVLVIGDDYNSEIQAAKELGIEAILYDSLGLFSEVKDVPRITSLEELPDLIN